MSVRIAACLAYCLLVLGAASAEPRRFAREDYARYFNGGLYETYSPYYDSVGRYEIFSSQPMKKDGAYALKQHMASLDVSPNYDIYSTYKYYKMASDWTDTLVWDARREAMIDDYTNAEFERLGVRVWESNNKSVAITEDDVDAGAIHDYYRRADIRAGRDADAEHEQYRKDSIGFWTLECDYLTGPDQDYDVLCRWTHLPTQRVEETYFRRRNLFS